MKEGDSVKVLVSPIENTLINTTKSVECLEKEAKKLAAFSNSAATFGNSTAVFSLLILQGILEQEAVDPLANLANIISITNNIANLNASIKSAVP